MRYELVTNSGLPTSEVHQFDDPVDDAVFVLRLEDDKYWVDYSTFVAKRLRKIELGLYRNRWLDKYKPLNFLGKYIVKPHDATMSGGNISDKLNPVWLQNSVFYSLVGQIGIENVRSSNTTLELGKKGFEAITDLTNNHSVGFDYNTVFNDSRHAVGESKGDSIGK